MWITHRVAPCQNRTSYSLHGCPASIVVPFGFFCVLTRNHFLKQFPINVYNYCPFNIICFLCFFFLRFSIICYNLVSFSWTIVCLSVFVSTGYKDSIILGSFFLLGIDRGRNSWTHISLCFISFVKKRVYIVNSMPYGCIAENNTLINSFCLLMATNTFGGILIWNVGWRHF